MKVLVTGGSGYIGRHVRASLQADDLSRRSGRNILDLQDAAAVKDYDMVIHLAAHLDKSDEGAGQTFLTNVEGTVNLLREMRPGSVFVFASTKDVYGRFADNYALVPENCPTTYAGQSALEWSKLIAERYVEYYAHSRGFRSCIFRLSAVYAPMSEGNVPNFVGYYAEQIDRGETITLPVDPTPVRDLMHVDDLARACTAFEASVIQHGLYNLGGGHRNALSLTQLVSKLEEVSGLEAAVERDAALAPAVPMKYISDLSLVTQELDWEPEIGLDEGLRSLFKRG